MAEFEDMEEGGGSQLSGRLSRISNISSNSIFSKAALSQRIVNVEYYMTAPVKEFDNMYSDFRSSAVKRVPVIRIFGSTPAGQKMCANIHGVYPYVSVLDDETVEGFEYRIATALDNAINDSIVTNKFGNGPMNNTQHVFKVLRVVGRTFYGYRSNNEVFLRIYFYNPLILRKAVDLLQSGSILGRRFQPYEAHIPYSLQFMIDYSLYGMNFVHYAFAKFRRKERHESNPQIEDLLPSSQGSTGSHCSFNLLVDCDSIPEHLLGPIQLVKSTLCELEIDVLASDIMSDTNSSGKSVNPGIDCIWKDEIERRRQHGVDDCSQITIPSSQERSQAELVHPTEDRFKQVLLAKVQSFFDESNAGSEMNTSFFETSQSLLEDPDTFPSSQVYDHLSSESKDKDVSDNQSSQEEEDFVKLLEEMAASVDNEQKEDEDININEPVESDQNDSLNEDANENENLWDDSFLSSSMLEQISDAETSYEESRKTEGTSDLKKSPVILQCDGQVDDSDSSSDEQSVSKRTRRSPRKSKTEELPSKVQENRVDLKNAKDTAKDKQRRKSSRLSLTDKPSPTHRLSLTMRRKSRSQDAKSSNSRETKSKTKKSASARSSPRIASLSIINPTTSSKEGDPTLEANSSSSKDEGKPINSKTTPLQSSPSSKSTKVSSSTTSHVDQKSDSQKLQQAQSPKDSVITNELQNVVHQVLQNKEIVLCLKKIDEVPENLSKRTRRKPKRFLQEGAAIAGTSSCISKSSGDGDTMEELKLDAAIATQSHPPPKTSGKKSKKTAIKNVESTKPEESIKNSNGTDTPPLNEEIQNIETIKSVNSNFPNPTPTKAKKKTLGMRKTVVRSSSKISPISEPPVIFPSLPAPNDNDTHRSVSTASTSMQSTPVETKDRVERVEVGNEAPPVTETDSKTQPPISINKKKPKAKKFSNVGVSCKPVTTVSTMQTSPVQLSDNSVQAQPETMNKSSQIIRTTQVAETQTLTLKTVDVGTEAPKPEMHSVESQTDLVEPLCLCQCTCVIKDTVDAGIDTQKELEPSTENKRIQVSNVDIITKAKSARFTTPQNNKIKITTPSRSPEKRRTLTDSPRRRPLTSVLVATHSRFLNALVMKTPTSTHKYRSAAFRESPSTPTGDSTSPYHRAKRTPPSKEEYLMDVLRSSCSPKPRRCSIKPRNLHNETIPNAGDEEEAGNGNSDVEVFSIPSSTVEREVQTTPMIATSDSIDVELKLELADPEPLECEDLSINSIYEYEEEEDPKSQERIFPSPAPAAPQILPDTDSNEDNDDDVLTPALNPLISTEELQLSSFQKKRVLSRNRSRIRLEKRRAATLEANREVPDIFNVEFEPLKQPPSYKSLMKWLEAEKHQNPFKTLHQNLGEEASEDILGNSSDEEEAPAPIKLFGGGNMSDEEDSDDPSSCKLNMDKISQEVKPFTPPPEFMDSQTDFDEASQSQGSYGATPRSILRQRTGSRRQSGMVLKRKIRWDDEDEEQSSKKRMRLEPIENGSAESITLTNESLNKTADTSELDGPSMRNALGLENSISNFQDVKALQQCQFLTTMCVEVHCASRNGLTPDPALDSILAIFILMSSDYPDNFRRPKECMHILFVENINLKGLNIESSQRMKAFSSEMEMLEAFFGLVRYWDPDMLVGYEVEKFSFGYLIQRGFHLGKDTAQELSRVLPPVRKDGKNELPRRNEEWNGTISGRIVLNLWRLLRHEIAVQSYTFENAAYHILRRRVYKLSYKALADFWKQKINRIKVIQYYTVRIKGIIQIMEKLDLINRTSELARLFGIQFYEVLSRGSQFRVESMMLRATKPLDYVAPSATITQRAKMRAPEFLPLILEPRSNYYTDPVAVLDFQSLYPSMMIAYNYDYASVIGRVEHLGSTDRFPVGCLDHQMSPGEILKLKDHIHISPSGVAFLDKSVVKGILPEMLEQILDTRQMVKRAMKKWKNEGASLKKVLDSRQLGLKLIANVTYGYTSANFSGRMPCVEIADSIVSKGRETLQRAIDFVKDNFNRWGAEVIYGDTDSMFLLFRSKTREEAFKLAYEIADEVTQANPKPVKLKFEKIYQPCILQSKKRYVGYSYETPDQEKPIYDAKGIETVRRDGCPAVRKILEKTLHTLFSTNKPKKVEEYVKFQFEKLFKGRVSMQDYIFAREFRGRSGYKPTACVPALEIAKKLTTVDPRAEPLTSERVPYVVVYGDPKLQLIKLIRRPEEYLDNSSMRLNAHYYIEKVIIPALNRCLMLAKMDASKWYLQMPRKYLRNVFEQKPGGQRTLDGYIRHQNCFRCDGRAERGLCSKCLEDETSSVIYLQEIVRNSKLKLSSCLEICTNCAGEPGRCISIDCPILHKLTRYERDQAYVKSIEDELISLDW